MVAMKVMYPYKEGMRFDMDYYIKCHMATSRELAKGACKGISVESALGRTDCKYAVVGTLLYESEDAYHKALDVHADRLLADIANFTDVQPDIMFVDIDAIDILVVK